MATTQTSPAIWDIVGAASLTLSGTAAAIDLDAYNLNDHDVVRIELAASSNKALLGTATTQVGIIPVFAANGTAHVITTYAGKAKNWYLKDAASGTKVSMIVLREALSP